MGEARKYECPACHRLIGLTRTTNRLHHHTIGGYSDERCPGSGVEVPGAEPSRTDYESGIAEGRRQAAEEIAAWLRSESVFSDSADFFADAIERGDWITGQNPTTEGDSAGDAGGDG